MKRAIIGITFVVMATLLGRCTTGIGTDGGGSEITNGKLMATGGAPVPGKEIRFYPESYVYGKNSDTTIRRTITGADGTFACELDGNSYTLYVVDSATRSGVCVRPVTAGTKLGIVRLDTLGSLAGTVRFADSLPSHPPLYVYCKGTPLRTSVAGKESSFRFDGIPSGVYTFLLAKQPMTGCLPGEDCNPGGGTQPGSFSSALVQSGGTTVIDTVISLDSIGTFR